MSWLEPKPPSARWRSRRRPNLDPVLRQRRKIDHPGLRKRRDVLRQQSIEKLALRDPEVAKRMVVDAHPAAHPTISMLALAKPRQQPRAADPAARRIQPQPQQQARRDRRMAGPPFARLDRVLQPAKVQLLHIPPDQTRRMIVANQALQIDRSQLDLIAQRLAQPRLASHIAAHPRTRNRQILEQAFPIHPPTSSPLRPISESSAAHHCNHIHPPERFAASEPARSAESKDASRQSSIQA